MRILVHGHLGKGNLGDELMLEPILTELGKRFPHAQLVIATGDKPSTNTSAFPSIILVPRNSLSLLWQIMRCQIFVIAGGTHVASFKGSRRHLAGIVRQLILVLFAYLTFSKTLMFSVGFGPFEEPTGERIARWLLHLTSFAGVRDRASFEWLDRLPRSKQSFSLGHDAALFNPREPEKRNQPVLGISLMPYFANYGGGTEKDAALVDQLAISIKRWRLIYPIAPVRLFGFLKQDSIFADVRILQILKNRFESDKNISLIDRDPDIKFAQEQFAEFTHFISMRYHSQVLAWQNEVPQLCITYHRKNRLFAAEYGIPKGQCFDIEEVLEGDLNQNIDNFFRHPDQHLPSATWSNLLADRDDLIPANLAILRE